MSKVADKVFDKHFEQKAENPEEMRATEQRSANLEPDALEPRLAMEADIATDTKTHNRMEDAEADQAKNGNSCSAKRVEDGPTSLTSFGMEAEPPALPRWDDVLVDKGASAPKPRLSPMEICMLSAAGGLLPAGKTSTAAMTIFHQLPIWFCLAREIKSRTC